MPTQVQTLEPMLRKLQLTTPLSEPDQAALLALPFRLHAWPALSHIVREGDVATHACVLLSGFAFRHKIIGDGGRQICSIHLPGDSIDLQNALLGRADHNVQALTPVETAMIPIEAIRAVGLAHPEVGNALWRDTLIDASIFREWIANVARRDATTRVAHLLCEFGIRLEALGAGEKTNFELPLTQEQLADATGLTSVHINRTLKELEEKGLITRTVRSIAVTDWKRLEQAGDFSSAYLHLSEAD